MTDVFKVQDEIAAAVVDELKIKLLEPHLLLHDRPARVCIVSESSWLLGCTPAAHRKNTALRAGTGD
jgi:hypothetical protein